ncbi:hypothetical protein RCH23_003401, partial [Cryobacterium sp. CAN_C3]|nr:hypothetical protein [Cryobacterium sp. CAN_C3]
PATAWINKPTDSTEAKLAASLPLASSGLTNSATPKAFCSRNNRVEGL